MEETCVSLWYIAFFFLDLDCFWLILYAKAQPVALPDFLKKKQKQTRKMISKATPSQSLFIFLSLLLLLLLLFLVMLT